MANFSNILENSLCSSLLTTSDLNFDERPPARSPARWGTPRRYRTLSGLFLRNVHSRCPAALPLVTGRAPLYCVAGASLRPGSCSGALQPSFWSLPAGRSLAEHNWICFLSDEWGDRYCVRHHYPQGFAV